MLIPLRTIQKLKQAVFYEGTYEGVMYQSESDATRLKIVPWAGTKSEGLIFTWDTATNNLVVDGVSTGDDLTQSGTDYGLIYASDFVTANVTKYSECLRSAQNIQFLSLLIIFLLVT